MIQLAADAYAEVAGYALFSVLADANADEQRAIKVLAAPPAGQGRVDFLVAKIPLSEVATVAGGRPWDTDSAD